jgi:hypothetical protein
MVADGSVAVHFTDNAVYHGLSETSGPIASQTLMLTSGLLTIRLERRK